MDTLKTRAAAALLLALAIGCAAEDTVGESPLAIANPDGTVVCHKGHEIGLPFAAIDNHLSHGDFLGPCEITAQRAASILVCHKGKEIELPFSAVDNHLSHDDFLGPCEPIPE